MKKIFEEPQIIIEEFHMEDVLKISGDDEWGDAEWD